MATKFLGTLKVVPKLVASDRKIGRAEKASKKHELIRLLTKYKTGGKNEAELTKETIARLMEYYL